MLQQPLTDQLVHADAVAANGDTVEQLLAAIAADADSPRRSDWASATGRCCSPRYSPAYVPTNWSAPTSATSA
jgi:hypothetical protein